MEINPGGVAPGLEWVAPSEQKNKTKTMISDLVVNAFDLNSYNSRLKPLKYRQLISPVAHLAGESTRIKKIKAKKHN